MKKFLSIPLGGVDVQICATGVACVQDNISSGADGITIYYTSGSNLNLAADTGNYTQADVDSITNAIIESGESKWTSVVSQVSELSNGSADTTVTFTF